MGSKPLAHMPHDDANEKLQQSQEETTSMTDKQITSQVDEFEDNRSMPSIGNGDSSPPNIDSGESAPDRPDGDDPFDLDRLRLSQDFGDGLGVKKALLKVPVRKPSKEWWIRIHPDTNYRIQTSLLVLKEDGGGFYLVAPHLRNALATESTVGPWWLFTAANRQGVFFIWPVRLQGPDAKPNEWNESAMEAASMAIKGWVRVEANMSLQAYDVTETSANIPEPQWPDLSFKDLLKVAFKDNYIDSLNHPVLKNLRGEA